MPGQQPPLRRNILDNEEARIGNTYGNGTVAQIDTVTLMPNGIYAQAPLLPNPDIGQPGISERLLDVSGDSRRGQMITLALSATLTTPGANRGGGPVVAKIEFGSGNARQTVEVDVPFGAATYIAQNSNAQQENSGIILSLPGSRIIVDVRNDGNSYAYDASEDPVPSLGGIVPPLPIGNPILIAPVPPPVGFIVSAFACYGTRSSVGKVKRLLPMLFCDLPGTAQNRQYTIPPLAKSVRLLRYPMTPLFYTLVNHAGRIFETGMIPAGLPSPVIDLPAQTNGIVVNTVRNLLIQMYGDFEIEV